MPRLTNHQYLYQRQRLRVSWQRRRAEPFAALNANEQLRLWAYFAPTQGFTDKEAIAHRKMASERFTSLPQQAGRAYVRILPYLDPERSGPVAPQRRIRKPRGRVVVQTVRRSEIDIHRLSRALLALAREDVRQRDT